MTSYLFDYIFINNIKVPTKLYFESEMGNAEQRIFNYKFYRSVDIKLD